MTMLYVWLAVFALGLIIELIIEGSLISIWFSVGALIPMIIAACTQPTALTISIEVIVFGVVSAICLIFLRKITKKLLFKNAKEKTNMEAYEHKTVKITKIENDGSVGVFKLNGIEYEAVFEDENQLFAENEQVIIKNFKGNKAIVSKKESK